ncbi:MAG: LysR family transcriptional regulator [Sphingobium sp.]
MTGENLRDMNAFLAVAQEGSFTRGAVRLGVSQSALSQTIRSLEERLGIRLFSRTTRSVAPTEAGERLLALVAPAMEEIEHGLAQLNELRDKPSGTIRISADEYAVQTVLGPALERFLPNYPDIRVEVTTDQGLIDIVHDRYDVGIRRGGLVSKDMIAVRIGPDVHMTVIGAPAYFEKHPRPSRPQDLTDHGCINLRLSTDGALLPWTFRKNGREHRVKVDGQLVFTTLPPIMQAAVSGLGLAYLPEEFVRPHLEEGRLVEVLTDWRHVFEGYHLYYPNRRQQTPAFSLLVEALRYRK